jgi:hypothetical protein
LKQLQLFPEHSNCRISIARPNLENGTDTIYARMQKDVLLLKQRQQEIEILIEKRHGITMQASIPTLAAILK